MVYNDKLHWETLNSEHVLKSRWMTVRKDRMKLPTGTIVEEYYCIEGNPIVAILAIDENKNVLLVKQYRHGVRDVTLDIPGGGIDPNETPIEAAHREFSEETGMQAGKMEQLLFYYPDSSRAENTKYIFLATDISEDVAGHQQDSGENIELVKMPLEEVRQNLSDGILKEATLHIAIATYLNQNDHL